jgi:hypothetical protein
VLPVAIELRDSDAVEHRSADRSARRRRALRGLGQAAADELEELVELPMSSREEARHSVGSARMPPMSARRWRARRDPPDRRRQARGGGAAARRLHQAIADEHHESSA